MIKIAFGQYDFRYRKENGKEQIFDDLRKKWVRLTPEEWVRQNWVKYILEHCRYPSSLIGIEKTLRLGELEKRFDLLVYDQSHQPWLLMECKAQDVELSTSVLDQVLNYHQQIPATYLMITNGQLSYLWKKENGNLVTQDQMPEWG
jgi:hypothetical protein